MEFSRGKFKLKNDRYAKSRGGPHNLLYIECASCDAPVLIYQKDGPGSLIRCYSDRIMWPPELVKKQEGVTSQNIKKVGALACEACGNIIGNPMIYEPEDRPAYRIVPGSIHIHKHLPPVEADTPSDDAPTEVDGDAEWTYDEIGYVTGDPPAPEE